MHVRVDRVVQVECSSENGAYDLPYVGIDKIEGHIAGLSGGSARTPRWCHRRCSGAGPDKGSLPASRPGGRTRLSARPAPSTTRPPPPAHPPRPPPAQPHI